MNEKLADALNEIRDEHIDQAAKPPKKRRAAWIGALAAVLAVVILVSSFSGSMSLRAAAISLADYDLHQRAQYEQVREALTLLQAFYGSSMELVLTDSQAKNPVYSPTNLYLALAMAAELSAGDGQLLQLLNASGMDALRRQANVLWNATYSDGNNKSLLAASLWLDQTLEYDPQILDILAQNYFASSYRGDLGSDKTNRDIAAWLNQQTGNHLTEYTKDIALDPETVFALYATVFFRAKWQDEFSPAANTEGIFHGPSDVSCTYMNKKLMETLYYWGEDFGAVALGLKDGSKMWLFLPDEGKTPQDLLASGTYLETALSLPREEDNSRPAKVNLSLPKFDISCSSDLQPQLEKLGITHIFDETQRPFAQFLGNEQLPVALSAINQATRVTVDEEGITAAAYIELPGAGAAPPPDEIIDFILDRPFLFVITKSTGVPLFAGIVNDPS